MIIITLIIINMKKLKKKKYFLKCIKYNILIILFLKAGKLY